MELTFTDFHFILLSTDIVLDVDDLLIFECNPVFVCDKMLKPIKKAIEVRGRYFGFGFASFSFHHPPECHRSPLDASCLKKNLFRRLPRFAGLDCPPLSRRIFSVCRRPSQAILRRSISSGAGRVEWLLLGNDWSEDIDGDDMGDDDGEDNL
jgi:hypothetical protein